MSNQFGKLPLVSGTPILRDVGGTGLCGIVIGNESGLTCSVTLQGASIKKTLYPGTVDKFVVPKGRSWNGNILIEPSTDLNNVNSWPSSHVYIDTYGINEDIPGVYPLVLNRAGNIGNVVTTAMGGSTSLQNDTNPASTVFIEATQSGGPASNVSATVDGSIQFNQWDGVTKKLLLQTIANAGAGNSSIKMLAAGLIAEMIGTLLITNNNPIKYKDNAGTARNLLNVDASNNVTLQGITGNDQQLFQNAAGTIQIIMDLVNGILQIPGKIQSLAGNTSGTVKCIEILAGALKICGVSYDNYKETGAARQFILTNGFSGPFLILAMGNGTMAILNGGTTRSGNYLATVAAAGGTFSALATIGQCVIGWNNTSIDRVQDQGGMASAHTGFVLFLGV